MKADTAILILTQKTQPKSFLIRTVFYQYLDEKNK